MPLPDKPVMGVVNGVIVYEPEQEGDRDAFLRLLAAALHRILLERAQNKASVSDENAASPLTDPGPEPESPQ